MRSFIAKLNRGRGFDMEKGESGVRAAQGYQMQG